MPVRFGELQAKLRRGDLIGGYVIGFTCLGPFDPITWTSGREMMDRSDVADMFHEELSAAGYMTSPATPDACSNGKRTRKGLNWSFQLK